MKLSAFLFLAFVTVSSAHAVTEASGDRAGTFSPSSEPAFDLQTDPSAGVRPVRIVIPDVGVFPGWLHDGIVEGTVKSIAARNPSPSALASEPDYLQFVK